MGVAKIKVDGLTEDDVDDLVAVAVAMFIGDDVIVCNGGCDRNASFGRCFGNGRLVWVFLVAGVVEGVLVGGGAVPVFVVVVVTAVLVVSIGCNGCSG